jgi:predicted secreted protein
VKFIQVMEQTGNMEEARAEIEGYFQDAGDDTKVRQIFLCSDRDDEAKIISIVHFDSSDSASENDDLDATKEGAAESQATTDITYRNLDVQHEWVR